MIEKLIDSIDILRRKIQFNVDLIHQNESKIFNILNEPVSRIRTKKLEARFNFNKKLLAENNDTLKLQQRVIEHLEKYSDNVKDLLLSTNEDRALENNTEQENNFIELEKDDYFQMTIEGVVEFNKQHPYYNDEKFQDALLDHHTKIENYEMCSFIIKLKKGVSVS